jgi:uncharacterized protein YciI
MSELLHLLSYEYVEGMLERRAPHREAHLELLRCYLADGRAVIGGAVGVPPHGALFAFREAADVQAFVADDPYGAAGLVTSWRVEPWAVV